MSSQELAVKHPDTAIARFTPEQVAESSLSSTTNLPELAELKPHFVPLSTEYWTPSAEGEEKLVFIAGISNHEVPDLTTGEIKVLECVLMLEPVDGVLTRYISASKVLVGNIKDAINRGEIIPMSTLTPVAIKFLGQKKNKSNAKLSNRWQILPLIQG